MTSDLSIATCKSCPLFSFNGLTTFGKVIDIYDGDTIDIVITANGSLFHFKARLYGYDSPEMKPPKDAANRDEIKRAAVRAKNRLWELLTGGSAVPVQSDEHTVIFPVACHEFDKYGRLLITVFVPGFDTAKITGERDEWFALSVNQQMITEGHGYPYYGGTKLV
jgi:endonuclease YncB( thermonuclease family)